MLQCLSGDRQIGLAEPVFLHPVQERGPRYAKQPGGLGLVAAGLLERGLEMVPFDLGERRVAWDTIRNSR